LAQPAVVAPPFLAVPPPVGCGAGNPIRLVILDQPSGSNLPYPKYEQEYGEDAAHATRREHLRQTSAQQSSEENSGHEPQVNPQRQPMNAVNSSKMYIAL